MSHTDFEYYLERYAEVIVKIGLNLQPGQRLLMGAFGAKNRGVPLEAAPLARAVAAKAYQAGARHVDVIWRDDQIIRSRFKYADPDTFEELPTWKADVSVDYMQRGDAIFSVSSYAPNLLSDQDPALVRKDQHAAARNAHPVTNLIANNATNWNVASAPLPGWDAMVLPDIAPEHREAAMWDLIFEMCRIKQDDPVAAWHAHIEALIARADYFNGKRYSALHLKAPGTDLRIGLADGHIWRSGGLTSKAGIFFSANIPTEEVFTMPHKNRVEGEIRSTKPLSVGGSVINNFTLTFEQGQIVKAVAEEGEAELHSLLETDAGASFIGEIALVPHSSPISQSGRLFYNILYDENASNHIALGNAYRFNMDGAESMSDAEYAAAGGNSSMIHVDFMVGSGEMDVDGITASGAVEPITRGGEWVFDV